MAPALAEILAVAIGWHFMTRGLRTTFPAGHGLMGLLAVMGTIHILATASSFFPSPGPGMGVRVAVHRAGRRPWVAWLADLPSTTQQIMHCHFPQGSSSDEPFLMPRRQDMIPSNESTGRVEGRFIVGVQAGPDVDSELDFTAAQGAIEFLASVPYLPNLTADPVQVTLLKTTILDRILMGKHNGPRLDRHHLGRGSQHLLHIESESHRCRAGVPNDSPLP